MYDTDCRPQFEPNAVASINDRRWSSASDKESTQPGVSPQNGNKEVKHQSMPNFVHFHERGDLFYRT